MCKCRAKTEAAQLRAILVKVLGCQGDPRRWLALMVDVVFWEHVSDVLGMGSATEKAAGPLFEAKELEAV